MTSALPLPYAGLRILDISQGIAGPYCAHILWQQGADVLKVEPPAGDWGRFVGVVRGQHSALSLQFNAGKRGLALDTRTLAGKALLHDLAMQADVIIQNFRPGVVERMGLGYAELALQKPDLVYVSISGYGADGPYADAPATDSVMQADSGLMFSNQDEQGTPRRVGLLMADISTGLYAAQATATALYQRLAQRVGTHVEVSLFEACAAVQGIGFLEQAIAGARPSGAVSAPNGVFSTADGKMSVVVLNNDQFARLCRALGRSGWLEDPRFADNASRMAHRALLHDEINTQLRQHTTAYWMPCLKEHDVLHAPVRNYDDVMNHPQALHLQMFQQLEQPSLGTLPYMGIPSGPYRRPVHAAPAIGEHSLQILSEAGIDPARVQTLLDDQVVFQS